MTNCVLFEDEHLLVVNKPAGMNTHAPSPYAGEGIYEWLKNREPRWATLAIIHRLDKETSGVIVFGKSEIANKSLTRQFAEREVRKQYVLLTDREVRSKELTVESAITRSGDKYVSRPMHAGADRAETRFRVDARMFTTSPASKGTFHVVQAEPVTGRTHQIRVHAADRGFPILGDTLYGGTPAARVYLHAAQISFTHPATGAPVTFSADPDFNADPRDAIRQAIIDDGATDAFRLVHGASDGWPGLYVERLGRFLLAQSEDDPQPDQLSLLDALAARHAAKGVYHKKLMRRVRGASVAETSPKLLSGVPAESYNPVRENGVTYALRFNEGYSVGIFLDQRENRRRLLTGYIAPGFFVPSLATGQGGVAPLAGISLLNTFAYTCAFSVCAAKGGAKVTSLDLSKKYLEWGKHHFELNGLSPAEHDFIYGDTFDWLRRFAKKGRTFDVVLLDPPTFSQSKEHGMFRAEKDYGKLVSVALQVLKPGGLMLCSTNAAQLLPERFLEMITASVTGAGRRITQRHYSPQPGDFPVSRDEPAYLKTVWVRVS